MVSRRPRAGIRLQQFVEKRFVTPVKTGAQKERIK